MLEVEEAACASSHVDPLRLDNTPCTVSFYLCVAADHCA